MVNGVGLGSRSSTASFTMTTPMTEASSSSGLNSGQYEVTFSSSTPASVSSSLQMTRDPGNPGEEMMKMVVEACVKAVSGAPGEDNGGQVDPGAVSQVHTIFATAAVCYGVHLIDCYVVKLYRALKKWEMDLTIEQKGIFCF